MFNTKLKKLKPFDYYQKEGMDVWDALSCWVVDRPGTSVEFSYTGFWVCKIVYRGASIMVPNDNGMQESMLEAVARIEKLEG